MSLTNKEKELVRIACLERRKAYAPYSDFLVGAALLAGNGTVFSGCNIENASYGATLCAERLAISKAIAEGIRDFSAIAIAGGPKEKPASSCAPCGICRQVMSEFCNKSLKIILANEENPDLSVCTTLGELFPAAFDQSML